MIDIKIGSIACLLWGAASVNSITFLVLFIGTFIVSFVEVVCGNLTKRGQCELLRGLFLFVIGFGISSLMDMLWIP